MTEPTPDQTSETLPTSPLDEDEQPWPNGEEPDTEPIPRKASSGKVRFRGRWTCNCVATSLPLVEDAMKRAGVIKWNVDIFQAGYNTGVSASAGTHNGGGATDVGQYTDAALRIWREWGWTQQHRTRAQGFSPHGHGWPKGCPHLASSARYQASEWQKGKNGLRSRGPITGPGPKGAATPSWSQAIRKHKAQVAASAKPKPPPKPKPPTPPKGILGMAKSIFVNYAPNQKISTSGWADVKINDKGHVSITGANGTVTVSAVLRVSGLVEGEWVEICWRLAEVVKKDGKDVTTVKHQRLPITVLGITDRKQNESLTFNGAVPKNQRLRLAVRTNSANLVIDQLEVQGWKE